MGNLQFMSFKGHLNEVKACLIRGDDVNGRDCFDWTPLHWAVANNQTEVAQLLMDNGANPGIPDESGRTPKDLAKTQEMRKIVGLRSKVKPNLPTGAKPKLPTGAKPKIVPKPSLQNRNSKITESSSISLETLVSQNGVDQVRCLLLDGSPDVIEALRNQSSNLLHLAVQHGKSEMVELLVKDISIPLHIPVITVLESIKIAAGANINALATFEGETISPLMLAVKMGDKSLVELLLQNEAEVSIQDADGKVYSAMDIANESFKSILTEGERGDQMMIEFPFNLYHDFATKFDLGNPRPVSAEIVFEESILQSHEISEAQMRSQVNEKLAKKNEILEQMKKFEQQIKELNDEAELGKMKIHEAQKEKVKSFQRLMKLKLSYYNDFHDLKGGEDSSQTSL